MHDRGTLAAFANGETRQVYAARRDNPMGPLVLLEDGMAVQMRAFTTAHLRCFVPECLTPAFTTVSRRHGRDGYRHLTGTVHAEESLYHRQGKQALLDWLSATHPHVRAAAEVPLDVERTRVADIMVTFPDGGRVALEVQYAGLDADESHHSWTTRTGDYQVQGVVPVWLFGHRGKHMIALGDDVVGLNAVHRAVLGTGVPLLWLNPTTSQVATPYVRAFTAGGVAYEIPPRPSDRTAQVWIDPLATLSLNTTGVTSTRLAFLAEQGLAFEQALEVERAEVDRQAALRAEAAQAEQDRLDRRAAARRTRDERSRAATVKRRRRAEASRQMRSERETDAWERSAMRVNVLAAHDGSIPLHLDLPSTGDGVYAHRQHWQAAAFGFCMRGHVGASGTVADCVAILRKKGIRVAAPSGVDALAAWVAQLHDLGFVRIEAGSEGAFTVTDPDVELADRERLVEAARAAELAARQRELEISQAAELATFAERIVVRTRAWRNSELRVQVVERLGGIPHVVHAASPTGMHSGIDACDEHWRSIVACTILDMAPVVSLRECMATVQNAGLVARQAEFENAMRAWLSFLVNSDFLIEGPARSYVVTSKFADLDSWPRSRALEPAAEVPRRRSRAEPPDGTCAVCAGVLAGSLIAAGRSTHTGCPPRPTRTRRPQSR